MPLFYPQVTQIIGGNTDGATASISSGVMTLAGGNNITLSQAGNAVTVVGAAGGAGLSAGLSNIGATDGNTGLVTGRLVLAGGNNITLSGSTNGGSMTITVSAPNLGAGAGYTAGISNIGNTSGDTGVVASRLVLAGGNNITLSGSTNGQSATVTISAFNQSVQTQMTGLSAGVSTGGNTAGTTGVVSNRIVFVGSNGVSLSQSANADSATITIRDMAKSFYKWEPLIGNASSSNTSNAVQSWVYVSMPQYINATRMDFQASLSANTNSTGQYTLSIGLYTLSGSTASLWTSTSMSRSWTSGTAAPATASSAYGGVSGWHNRTIALGTWNITPGEYLVGVWMRTTGGAQTWAPTFYFLNSIPNLQDVNETQYWDHGYSSASYSTAMIGSINLTDTNYIRTSNLNRAIPVRFYASNS